MSGEAGKKSEQYTLAAQVVPKYQLKFKGSGTVKDHSEYAWFTPALLYLWGSFTDVQLYDVVTRRDIQIFWYKFQKPIFKNIPGAWSQALWACKADKWDDFCSDVLEVVALDARRKTYMEYALQRISVMDPLQADSSLVTDPSAVSLVDIGVFAVRSNKFELAIMPDNSSPFSLPACQTLKPTKSIVNLSADLFRDDADQQEAVKRLAAHNPTWSENDKRA